MTTMYRKYLRQYIPDGTVREMDFNHSDSQVDCHGGYLTETKAMEWINKWNASAPATWAFWIRRSDGVEKKTVYVSACGGEFPTPGEAWSYAEKQFLRVDIAETLCVNAGVLKRHEALALADILLAQFDINTKETK